MNDFWAAYLQSSWRSPYIKENRRDDIITVSVFIIQEKDGYPSCQYAGKTK